MPFSRRRFIQNFSALSGALILSPELIFPKNYQNYQQPVLRATDFGKNFTWGTASAAFQTEGAWNKDGKSPSIWDTFSEQNGKIKNGENARTACDFYNRYPEDISLLKNMNFGAFRFSLSWPRILPGGTGAVNQKGIDYYNRLIDTCLEQNITPWITLYHWDLPQILEDKGGWTNRDIVSWFEEYCFVAASAFGDRVKNWIVLNEPMAFTSFGYLLGTHAPGKKGLKNFYPAVHHAALCQSLGAGTIKRIIPDAQVGSTFSCSQIDAVDDKPKNIEAAKRIDAALNRLFIEPAMGLGYPVNTLPFLDKMEKYFKPGDEELLKADFDFIGIQYYFRIVVKSSLIPPIFAREVKPEKRNVAVNTMGMEVYPEGIYAMIEKFSKYSNIKKIYITESGVCFDDTISPDGSIADYQRTQYFKATLEQVLKAKNAGFPVEGFFVWSLTDNFEWNFGYSPRFGLVYIDYPTQKRILKDSGKWFKDFM